ncbi:MAG: ABC transporter ATP-binding protein [Spirochaetaceae bacterium]|nr:ABC transporter ATP-binding protein [Spirochaetaceae bacterium]
MQNKAQTIPVIEFKDFSYKYRTQSEPTLKNISLAVNKGEKVLIIGSSGSGKSTIAKCINGLIPSSYPGKISGSLSVCGLNPEKEGIFGMSKHVGTVLQDTDGQFIGLTVAEDIAFALENDDVPFDEMHKKVDEAAEIVDVKKLLKSVPGALSGGQKQRVSLAGILVDDVEVLLFDEPLANLDPAAGKRIISLIDEINKNKEKTVIIIEHRLEDVLYKDVDRIIIVEDGQIAADETPDKLLCTDLFREKGIRESLYIAALKHAGCKLKPEDKPMHIETMNVAPYKAELLSWFKKIEIVPPVPQTEKVLELRNVCFKYDAEKPYTVENINFSISRGEMVSIVGTNGAGKSTIASLICGFNRQNEGQIFVNGEEISSLSITQRGEKIGFVMQNQNQMISKSIIFDEVALGLKVRNVPKDEIKERVNNALKTCGMYPYRNWPVSAISFGQKKRVTIASILVMKPEIIILDEPTAGQDYAHYTEIMEFLRKLNREQNLTILMITHDMHLMLEYTDRAIVVSDGHIIADGKSSVILTDEAITEAASLKKTSLYDLSVKCGIEKPDELVDRFIHFERGLRGAL